MKLCILSYNTSWDSWCPRILSTLIVFFVNSKAAFVEITTCDYYLTHHCVKHIGYLFKRAYLHASLRVPCVSERSVNHYNDVTIGEMASQITSITIVYSTVYSGADQRKHQSSASLAFVRGFHRWPVNSPHKWPVTRRMFPFDDVIMWCCVKDPFRCDEIMLILWLWQQPKLYSDKKRLTKEMKYECKFSDNII